MKKHLVIIAVLLLALAGCGKPTEEPFRDIVIEPTAYPTAVPIPTSAVISPKAAHSHEEALAQAMERASKYKIDVYDVRLFNANPYGLPLRTDVGYPTVVLIIEILDGDTGPAENQVLWQTATAGIKALAGQEALTGFHYFFVSENILHAGLWCPPEALNIRLITDAKVCIGWPGVAPLPPEMARFKGF